MKSWAERVFFSAPAWRALLEGSLAGGLCFFLLALAAGEMQSPSGGNGIAFAGAIGGTLAALRMRPFRGSWIAVILQEGLASAALDGGILLGAFVAPALAGRPGWIEQTNLGTGGILLAAGTAPGFLFLRVVFLLLSRWNRLRRSRLLWGMTHAFLSVTLLSVAALLVLIFIYNATYNPARDTSSLSLLGRIIDGILVRIFPISVAVVLLTGAGLAFLLPFYSLISFLVARRLTRRIERLGQAARVLRAGDLAARVTVEGEDELAQLQGAFNEMAAGLQRASRDLQAERDRLAALLRAHRELAAGVSHELRTPVATLRGYVETGLKEAGSAAPEELRGSLETMEGEITRLQRLIDDLFTLSRAEVNALALELKPVDAGRVLQRVVSTAAPLAWQSSRVELSALPIPQLPAVLADETRLEQILINLVQNGVRYTPPGGVVVAAAEAADGWVTLHVADSGPGIPAGEQARIWERFYRAPGSEDSGGAGLGLALVKELAEAMGGRACVDSTPGEGSRFSVSFPAAIEPSQ